MSRYRKIEVRTWSDEKFRALSSLPPSGQGLWFFLLTGPHTTAIPGLFRAGRAAMAEELNWEMEAFDEAFAEVTEQGMAKADFKAKLVWLPKAISHNKPESPNVVRGWRVELDLLPECDLKREAISSIRSFVSGMGAAYLEAFDELFTSAKERSTNKEKGSDKPLVKPSTKPNKKDLKKATPNQEQEQEQEQELVDAPSPQAAPAPTDAARGTRLPADWELPDDWRAWAEGERADLDPDVVADSFRDFWVSKPGKDGRKCDWQATWRNWVRSQKSVTGSSSVSRSIPVFAGGI